MSTADPTNMELEESAIDSTALDPASAAAAAAMSDLSDQPSPAIAGQLQRGRLVPACPSVIEGLFDAS
jgi:hypothetical protein